MQKVLTITQKCPNCGTDFSPKQKSQKLCSRLCSRTYNVGKNHYRWKGGWLNAMGYKMIKIDRKNVLEHRYLMEQHLGRKLSSFEIVHHIDGNKLNNNIENLVVMNQHEHMVLHDTGKKNIGRYRKGNSVHERICNKCHITLPLTIEYFGKKNGSTLGLDHKCKQCRMLEAREYRKQKKYL